MFKKIAKFVVPAAMIAVPLLTLASIPVATNPINDNNNPLTLSEVQSIIQTIASFIMIVAVVIAVIAIVWGAIVLITAGGSADRTKTGWAWIWKGIVGAAVVFAIGIILQTVAGLVSRTFFG